MSCCIYVFLLNYLIFMYCSRIQQFSLRLSGHHMVPCYFETHFSVSMHNFVLLSVSFSSLLCPHLPSAAVMSQRRNLWRRRLVV